MRKATIEKEVFIDENPTGDTVSGYLMLKATETITLDGIRGKVFIETRGKVSTCKYENLSIKISDETELIQNESSKVPFTINLSSLEDLYQGVNVKTSYLLQVLLFVKESDVKKVEKHLFSESYVRTGYSKPVNMFNLHKHFSIEKTNIIQFHDYVSIKKTDVDFKYQVVEEKNIFENITKTHNWYILLLSPGLIALMCTPIVIALKISNPPLFIALVITFFTASILLVNEYIRYSTWIKISMETLQDKDGFICRISTNKKINLKAPSLSYTITEAVIDDRATTITTRYHTLFTSNIKQLDNSKTSQELKFLYPPQKNELQPCSVGEGRCFSVKWNMIIKGIFLGFTVKHRCPINIKTVNHFNAS